MKNIPLLLGTIIGSIVLIFGIGFLFSKTAQPTATAVDRAVLETDLLHTRGATESAKVVVVEFSDFQCPACRAAESLVDQLSQEYADRVTFAYRHFPLEQIHANARAAAIAAEAAAVQNAFWTYHDVLFDKQDEWSKISDAKALQAQFVTYAESLNLNRDQFVTDLEKAEVIARVTQDTALANQLKVNSTPTFFVNGIPVSTSELKAAIEAQLATQ
jgi:protein-disulfide isomerase